MLDRVHTSLGSEYVVNIMSITSNMNKLLLLLVLLLVLDEVVVVAEV